MKKINGQYIRVFAWMNELGLTLAEKIVFAVICSYTEYKGWFDGDAKWMSAWAGISADETESIFKKLVEADCIIPCGESRYGTRYKASALSMKKNGNINNINNINNNNNKNNINNINTISKDPEIKETIKKAAERPDDPSRERIIALMDEYGDITKIPYERLAEACGKGGGAGSEG